MKGFSTAHVSVLPLRVEDILFASLRLPQWLVRCPGDWKIETTTLTCRGKSSSPLAVHFLSLHVLPTTVSSSRGSKVVFCSLFVSDLVCFMSFCLLLIVCSPMFSTSSRNLPSTWLSVAEGAHLLPNSHLHGCQKDLGFSFIEVHRFHFRMFTQTCLNRRIGGKVDFMKGLFLPCDCEPTFLRPKSVRPLRTAPQAMRIPTPGLRRRGSGVAAWRTFVVQTWAMDNCEVYWCLLWHVIFNGTSRQGFSRARLEYQSVFISKFQSNFICWTLSRDSVYYDEARI